MLQDLLRVIPLFFTTAHNIICNFKGGGNFHWLSSARFHHLPGPVFDKKEETNSDIDNYTRLKWCYSPQSLQAKLSFEAKNCPFVVFLQWNKIGDSPFLFVFFTHYGYTKNKS